MIEIFEGRLGAGKSYSAVVRIMEHLGAGGTVATNIELQWEGVRDYVRAHYGVEVEPEQLVDLFGRDVSEFHKLTPAGTDDLNTLAVLDEAGLDFNARDWSACSKDLLAFLAQSRKQNTDVIFIVQHFANLDKQFVRLSQFVWAHRDMERWQVPGLGISFPALCKLVTFGANRGDYILACCYDYDLKTLYSKRWVKKSPEVFRSYKTKSIVRSFERAGTAARRALKRTEEPQSNRPKQMIKVLAILALLGVGGALYIGKSFGKSDPAPSKQQSAKTGASILPGDEKPKGAYDVYAERFVGWYGAAGVLRTDAGSYQVGEMSGKGFVVAVSDRRAKLAQPDGRTGWIVAQELPMPAPVEKGEKVEAKKEDAKATPVPAQQAQVAAVKPPSAAPWWPSTVPGF